MFEKLQKLSPADAKRRSLESEEVPALAARIKEFEKQIPELRFKADEVCLLNHSTAVSSSAKNTQEKEKLDEIKLHMRDLNNLKQQATTIARLQKEAEKARHEATSIENELINTGSSRTADDVQQELDELSGALYVPSNDDHLRNNSFAPHLAERLNARSRILL